MTELSALHPGSGDNGATTPCAWPAAWQLEEGSDSLFTIGIAALGSTLLQLEICGRTSYQDIET